MVKLFKIMIAKVLESRNFYKSECQVVRNKVAGGIDGMRYLDLSNIEKNSNNILNSFRNNSDQSKAILGVSISKRKGDTRLLGISKVIDRWL